ncbi:DUF402 domain-containing protein [Actinoplanes sp. NPDC026619]|uniref:DUF402 domain-containing protein n=1 Tax=Actinoplanes sp. NPDC026619 TaxID=3155798 RepID=UPI0033F7A524
MTFSPGRLVLHRDTHLGRVAFVHPSRVISDDERGLLVWLARGSAIAAERSADGRGPRDMPFAEWSAQRYELRPASWQGPGVLRFFPTGAAHSVWFFRTEAGDFKNYYINLEEPAVRWDDGHVAGFDVIDQDLDIVAAPDLAWEWKDEDEFAERLAMPDRYWVPDEAAVWSEGRRVIKMIEAAEFPFDGTWTDFEPDPTWETPIQLPEGWNRPLAVRS